MKILSDKEKLVVFLNDYADLFSLDDLKNISVGNECDISGVSTIDELLNNLSSQECKALLEILEQHFF